MVVRGNSVLIVESRITSFVTSLQAAIDGLGAESMVVRNQEAALERCKRFTFSAALVNAEHRGLLDDLTSLGIPPLVYVRTEEPTAITASLAGVLKLVNDDAAEPARERKRS